MNCELFTKLLETSGSHCQESGFVEHKKSCPRCFERFFERSLQEKLRKDYRALAPSPFLRERIRAHLPGEKTLRARPPFFVSFLKSSLVFAVGLLLFAVTFSLFQGISSREAEFEPYLEHVLQHEALRPRQDVAARNMAEVKAYLASYPVAHLPTLPQSAKLSGASICDVDNRKVVHLFYRYHGEPLHFMFYPHPTASSGILSRLKDGPFHTLAYSGKGLICVFISKLPLQSLAQLAQAMASSS